MKKEILALIIVAVFAILAFCLPKGTTVKAQNINRHTQSDLIHICADTTHKTCDGNCQCDGLGCNK